MPVAAQWYARALGATELWNLGSVVGLDRRGSTLLPGRAREQRMAPLPPLARGRCGSRSSSTTPTASSNVPWQLEPTTASTRSATTRHHGAFTVREASSTRSVTCGSSATDPRWARTTSGKASTRVRLVALWSLRGPTTTKDDRKGPTTKGQVSSTPCSFVQVIGGWDSGLLIRRSEVRVLPAPQGFRRSRATLTPATKTGEAGLGAVWVQRSGCSLGARGGIA